MGASPTREAALPFAASHDGRRVTPQGLVVVSPHLDDAVLSAWSTVRDHDDVTVLTCFAGEPSEDTPPSAWDREGGATSAAEWVRLRRAEDREVLGSLGATALHLDHLDVPYRPGSDPVVQRLAQELKPLLQEAQGVLAPLGLGGHPDHITTRDAVLAVAPAGRVQLYADLPYASQRGWPRWVRRGRSRGGLQLRPLRHRSSSKDPSLVWARALRTLPVGAAVVHRLGDPDLASKQELLARYSTEAPRLGLHRRVDGEDALRYEVRWAVRT